MQSEERSGRQPAEATDGHAFSSLSAVSNEMVRVYKEQFGRGPTAVRTSWAGPDVLVVLLENTFTRAELNLRDMGEHQRLRDLRLYFQYASTEEFCEPVERIMGRKVRAFISGIDTETDIATELFVLHPNGDSAVSRRE